GIGHIDRSPTNPSMLVGVRLEAGIGQRIERRLIFRQRNFEREMMQRWRMAIGFDPVRGSPVGGPVDPKQSDDTLVAFKTAFDFQKCDAIVEGSQQAKSQHIAIEFDGARNIADAQHHLAKSAWRYQWRQFPSPAP